MRDDLGVRVERIASKDLVHGQAVVEGGIVGWASKSTPLGRYVDPASAGVAKIVTGETYVLFLGGKHELALTNATGFAPTGTVVKDLLWIDPDDNKVKRGGAAAAGDFPLGVVEEVDAVRTPDAVMVNANAWNAFFPHA